MINLDEMKKKPKNPKKQKNPHSLIWLTQNGGLLSILIKKWRKIHFVSYQNIC